MRKIDVEIIKKKVKELFLRANYHIGEIGSASCRERV